jgi:cell division protein FtsB
MMNRKLKQLPAKGLIVVLMLFIVWMLFLDQNNWMKQWKLSNQLHEAQAKENYYKQQIIADSLYLIDLNTDDETLEKLAREKYLMKKDDETVYLIVRDGEKTEAKEVQ